MIQEIPRLFDELREICTQYAGEVPKKRRPWPESIKTRVLRLRFLGVSNHRIAQEVGIPVMTLYTWRMPSPAEVRAASAPVLGGQASEAAGQFLPVRIAQRATALVPSGQRGAPPQARLRRIDRSPTTVTVKTTVCAPGTLTVVTVSGIRLEGLTLVQAIEAAQALSATRACAFSSTPRPSTCDGASPDSRDSSPSE
jgi:transposase-like protein